MLFAVVRDVVVRELAGFALPRTGVFLTPLLRTPDFAAVLRPVVVRLTGELVLRLVVERLVVERDVVFGVVVAFAVLRDAVPVRLMPVRDAGLFADAVLPVRFVAVVLRLVFVGVLFCGIDRLLLCW